MNPVDHVDVCVYGGTPAGCAAAVASRQEGASVVLIEPSRWLGGILGAGIKPGQDCPLTEAVGGLTASRILRFGDNPPDIRANFVEWLQAENVPILYEHRLQRVQLRGSVIEALNLGYAPPNEWGIPAHECRGEQWLSIHAGVFIDASYEGDLMAGAGVSFRTGREAASAFGEEFAGSQAPTNWTPIDPFVSPGSQESGLLSLVEPDDGLPYGSADNYTQAYNFRPYLTADPDTRMLLTPPDSYEPAKFELVGRYVEHLVRHAKDTTDVLQRLSWIFPGWLNEGEYNYQRKSLITMAPVGLSREYQDGNWATRALIWQQHVDYLRGLHHFLCTDSRVPEQFRHATMGIGLDSRMHIETEGWPNQLYVRVARRMKGIYTLTEADVLNRTAITDSIGLALYGVDTYPVRRILCEDRHSGRIGVATEGDMFIGGSLGTGQPYAVPYRAITPVAKECSNLLVPVCFSATHIAYASARMEPVFSLVGESAGVAAVHALREQVSVQDVDVQDLQARLIARGQKLAWEADETRDD